MNSISKVKSNKFLSIKENKIMKSSKGREKIMKGPKISKIPSKMKKGQKINKKISLQKRKFRKIR